MNTSGLRTCLGLAGAAGMLFAQPRPTEVGHANIRELPVEVLPEGVSVVTIGQLPDGRMIWGTADRVLVFDGHTTETIPLPDRIGALRQTHGTPDGRILITAANYAAVATPTSADGWLLRDWLPARTNITEFRTDFQLVERDGTLIAFNSTTGAWLKGEQWVPWPTAPPTDPAAAAPAYWLTQRSLYRFTAPRQLERWTDGAWRFDRTLAEEIPPAHGKLFETTAGELRLMGPSGQLLALSPEGNVRLVAPPGPGDIRDIEVAWFEDGSAVVLAGDASLRILDATGQETARVDESNGFAIGDCRRLFVDRQGQVWTALDSTVARIEFPQHVTRFNRSNGLDATQVLAVARYRDRLYAGTNGGVYVLASASPTEASSTARFLPVAGIHAPTPALLVHDDTLFVGARDGVYGLDERGLTLLVPTDAQVTAFSLSPFSVNRIYVGTSAGALALQRMPTGWTRTTDRNDRRSVSALLEYAPDAWLMQSGRDRLVRFERRQPQPQVTTNPPSTLMRIYVPLFSGLFEPNPVSLFNADGDAVAPHGLAFWRSAAVIVTDEGLYDTGPTPQPLGWLDPNTRASLRSDRRLQRFSPDGPDRAWVALAPRREAARQGLSWQVRAVGLATASLPQILPAAATDVGEIHALLAESRSGEDVLWVGGENGLRRVRLAGLRPPAAPSPPHLAPSGNFRPDFELPALPAKHPPLAFTFATPGFARAPIAYRSRLVHNDQGDWTPFAPEAHRPVGLLGPGTYRFEVQARNADGLTSPITRFTFTVQRPWWQSAGVVATALVALGAGIVGLVMLVSRRQRQHQAHLEALIAERTAALRANEQQLSLAKDEAESASRAKSTFLAAMSHELRTPLNAILGFAHLLQRESGLSAKGRNQLAIVDRNGRHLLETINEVLDISKIEAEEISLHPTPCTLARLLSDLSDLLEPPAAEKGIALRIELGPDLPRRVRVDVSRLRQVLINLLGNAVKFTDHGQIILRCAALPEGRIRFEISDTGPGISPADQARIFLPFHQTPAGTRQRGTGLGLAISQRLVARMGGTITVTSTPGQGSTFAFELPLPPAPSESRAPFTPQQLTGYHGTRRRLLAVDDEGTNLELLVELLTPLGFTVETATNTTAAETALARQTFDASLIDIRLPGEDGLTFVRRYRAAHAEAAPPFIAVSASVFESDRHEALAAGCRDFLPKPIHPEALLGSLREQLGLEWIVAPPAVRPTTPAQHELPRPAEDVRRALLDLVRQGDLDALCAHLNDYPPDALDPRTAAHLQQLARHFETAALRAWLSDPPSSSA